MVKRERAETAIVAADFAATTSFGDEDLLDLLPSRLHTLVVANQTVAPRTAVPLSGGPALIAVQMAGHYARL
jgi:hypothetical protein